MKIIAHNDIDRSEWSRLVQSSATGTWFQTPEAYDFFASQPDIFEPFVIGIEKSEPRAEGRELRALRGVCVGYVTVEKSVVKQFFTRRAIIIGGPALADDCTDEEVTALLIAIKTNLSFTRSFAHSFTHSPIYIETRNFNDYSKWRGAFEAAGFAYQPHLNFHVDCTNKEAMDSRLSENRKRQIKKAIKSGVEIKSEGISEAEIKEWYEILHALYKTKVKTPLFPLSFFLEFYRKELSRYLLVKYEGKVIGGIMCPIIEKKGVIYEWFVCGKDEEYKNKNPSVMATYAAMEYANAHGLARFDFMGAGEPGVPYGVRDFKEEFGGTLVEHGRFLHVANPILYLIGKIGVRMLKRIG